MKNNRGEGYIEICIFVTVFCIILSVMISFVTTVETIRQTKRNSRVVLDSFVMKNSVEIYDSIKQGEDTVYGLDSERYIAELCSFCSLQRGIDCLIFEDENGNEVYAITKPIMEFADRNRMKIQISYTVQVPLNFAGLQVTKVNIPITVTSNLNQKFEEEL